MLNTMSGKLVAEEGLLKDLVLSFEEGDQWVIGRDPDGCQLLIEDPTASRKHLLCRRTSNGISIENLSTTNPVLVNGETLAAPHQLENGDLVKIGDTTFRFYEEEGAHLYEEPTHDEEASEELEDKTHDSILEMDEKGAPHGFPQINFDLMETGRWLLKVVGGPNNGAEFSMHAGNNYTLGTDPNLCDIVFYDTSVSRQHARISVTEDDQLFIEDLKSRNGTRLDGELIQEKRPLPTNMLVVMGTSTLVVYDREGEMQTIISPLLPSIVKVLQKEEEEVEAAPKEETPPPKEEPPAPPKPKSHNLSLLLIALSLLSLFAVAGIGIKALFTQHEVERVEPINPDVLLQEALKPFPNVKYSFNKATGRLFLIGHVLSSSDKSQMLNNLQGLTFIHDVDESGVIIDEYVWSEINQVLSRNPNWRGVTVHAPSAGHFVLSGYLQSRKEAELLWDYITRNFSYVDLLEDKIIVEENILNGINVILHGKGFGTVNAQLNSGELSLNGVIPIGKQAEFEKIAEQFKTIQGIRLVKNFVKETAQQETLINISDKYAVTGFSRLDSGKVSVIVNGRILEVGDVLDGMKVTKIQPDRVLLEKDRVVYRIDVGR